MLENDKEIHDNMFIVILYAAKKTDIKMLVFKSIHSHSYDSKVCDHTVFKT